jgi:alginate O-acetyltransferase complex protein AlgJ
MSRVSNLVLVVSFILILLAPTVANVAGLNPMSTLNENRALAKRPMSRPWILNDLRRGAALAKEWETYFNDNFGFRKLLIGTYRLATFHLFRSSPHPAVVLGEFNKEGRWLYFDAPVNRDGAGFDAFLGEKPFTSANLASIAAFLRQSAELARKNGVRFVFVVCPDKQTIYPDYLPAKLSRKTGSISRLDQFWTMAEGLQDVPLVDLRKPLREARKNTLLYFPTDTHWNYRGGFLGYQMVAKALAIQDPSLEPMSSDSMQWTSLGTHEGDLARMLGLPMPVADPLWGPVVPKEVRPGKQKEGKLLVLGDSFYELMKVYFAPHFETVKSISVKGNYKKYVFTQALLDAEKPDVVIMESVERYWTMD